jgi:hypothetical protein
MILFDENDNIIIKTNLDSDDYLNTLQALICTLQQSVSYCAEDGMGERTLNAVHFQSELILNLLPSVEQIKTMQVPPFKVSLPVS